MIELCCCGHANDHSGRACAHEAIGGGDGKCACKFGQRVDVAQFRVAVDQIGLLNQINATMQRLLAVVEIATNLRSRLVDSEEGLRVEVQKLPQAGPRLVVPR